MNTVADVKAAKTAELVAFYNANSEKPVKKFTDRATAEKRVIDLLDDIAEKAAKAQKSNQENAQEFAQEVAPQAAARMEAPVKEVKEEKEFTLKKIHFTVLRNIALSDYTALNGAEPSSTKDIGMVWANVVADGAKEHRAMHELIKAGYVVHDGGKGAEACVTLTQAGLAQYKLAPAIEQGEAAAERKEAASNAAGVAASWADPKVVEARLKRDGVFVKVGDSATATEYRSVRKAFEELGLPDSKHIRFRMKLKEARNADFEGNGTVYHFSIA